jgi:biopolymer transport protein ExbD
MPGITQPLEFRKFIGCAPKSGFDLVPFLDAILIALFVALNASAFIIAPGTAIRLPESSSAEMGQSSVSAVLTVDRNELYFFDGAKLSSLTLESHLADYVRQRDLAKDGTPATLLIKADATISTGSLFQLMDLAGRAGFSRVHLASELPYDESGLIPPSPTSGQNR